MEWVAIGSPLSSRVGSSAQARGSHRGLLHLLCVAALIPRKGHQTLARALAMIVDDRWRLTCVGSVHRDPRTVEQLLARLRADGLEDRVVLAGEVDESTLAARYDDADVFVLPTYCEGYGMAVAEALAHGLPVISSATGAIPALLADGAGLLVPAGDRRHWPTRSCGFSTRILRAAGNGRSAGTQPAANREDATDKMANVLRPYAPERWVQVKSS